MRIVFCIRTVKLTGLYYTKCSDDTRVFNAFIQNTLEQTREFLEKHNHDYAKIQSLCDTLYSVNPGSPPTDDEIEKYPSLCTHTTSKGEVRSWSLDDVQDWLLSIDADEELVRIFAEEDIDGEVLYTLNENDLRDLGVASFGQRRKLMLRLAELTQHSPTDNAHNKDWSEILSLAVTDDNFLEQTFELGVYIESLHCNPNEIDFTVMLDLQHRLNTFNIYRGQPGDIDFAVVCSVNLAYLPNSLQPYFLPHQKQVRYTDEVLVKKLSDPKGRFNQ